MTITAPRRKVHAVQLVLAGAAAIAMFTLFDAARPDSTDTLPVGSIRLAGQTMPMAQTAPNLGGGGLATDDTDDWVRQQQQQIAQQQLQQSMQAAEQQNEQAQQQAQQAEQQAQIDQQQIN
jgi:hypothetical protein